MNARISHSRSVNKRTVVSVVFERETPEANAPVIEATFEYRFPQDFSLVEACPGFLIPLSVTRTDTRQTIELTEEDRDEVYQRASDYAASFNE